MDRWTVGYWTTTALFCAVVGFSGFSHFTHTDMMVEAKIGLGYPLYFMSIIGLAKMLGVVAVLVPRHPLLKEWAYAGITFNLIGATASHLFSGDGLIHASRPAFILLLCILSYLLRPAARRLSAATSLSSDAALAN